MNARPVAVGEPVCARGGHPGSIKAVEESLQDLLARRGAAFAIHRRTGDLAVEVVGAATRRLYLEFDTDASPAEVRDTVGAALEHFTVSRLSFRR